MSHERIFNVFFYFEGGIAREYGIRYHRINGSDDEKTTFLRDRVEEDHPIARRFLLSRTFTSAEWFAAQRHGDVFPYFQLGLDKLHAPAEPIFCLTAIVDGKARIDRTAGPGPFQGDEVSAKEGWGAVPDYLVHYRVGDKFKFTELIHDDYFKAIQTLFNAKLYVSCSKLLMSCIDSLGFVEYGDEVGSFTRWLDTYANLLPHNISAAELWEFRNSILHMTNVASRKILSGAVSPIVPIVGAQRSLPPLPPGIPKPFNLLGLIQTIGDGIGEWADSYNQDRDKFFKFIERYDQTISDSRMTMFPADSDRSPGSARDH